MADPTGKPGDKAPPEAEAAGPPVPRPRIAKGVFGAPPPPSGSLPPLSPQPSVPPAQDPVSYLAGPSAPPQGTTTRDDDPVAKLFSADQALPLPSGLGDEAQGGRWQTATRGAANTSLFDEVVADPPAQAKPEAALESEAPAASPEPVAPPQPPAHAPPVPAAARKRKVEDVASDTAPVAPPALPAQRAAASKAAPKKDPPTGLKMSLAVFTLIAIGAVLIALGVLPNPSAEQTASAPAAVPTPPPAQLAAPPAPPPPTHEAKSAAPLPVVQNPARPTAPTPPPAAQATAEPARVPSAQAAPPRPAQEPPKAATKPTAAAPAQPAPAKEATALGPNDPLFVNARKLLADDDASGAETLARQALSTDPQSHHAMELLARALMDQDRGDEALPFAQKIVQRRGKRVPYRLLYGDLLLMTGDESGAKAQWEAALALAPNDKDIKRRLGL